MKKTSKNFYNSWFIPNSAILEDQLLNVAINTAQQTPEAYLNVVNTICMKNKNIFDIEDIKTNEDHKKYIKKLKHLFDKNGSDKSSENHKYHLLYSVLLYNLNLINSNIKLLEIGLGSNNINIPSNMGIHGKPGASIKSFKEFLPDSIIHGADIDDTIYIEGCKTFFVDQTDPLSFNKINENGENKYDLIIDDGLHSTNANLFTLDFALKKISNHGFIVIEDISEKSLDIWKSLEYQFESSAFNSLIIKTKSAYIFLVSKIDLRKILF